MSCISAVTNRMHVDRCHACCSLEKDGSRSRGTREGHSCGIHGASAVVAGALVQSCQQGRCAELPRSRSLPSCFSRIASRVHRDAVGAACHAMCALRIQCVCQRRVRSLKHSSPVCVAEGEVTVWNLSTPSPEAHVFSTVIEQVHMTSGMLTAGQSPGAGVQHLTGHRRVRKSQVRECEVQG